MNSNYQKPALDIEKFEVEDVITRSNKVEDGDVLSVVTVVDFN